MVENLYYERRLALREGSGREVVETIAGAGDWAPVPDPAAEAVMEHAYVRTWGVLPWLWLSYVEDLVTGVSVAVAFGEDSEAVESLGDRVSSIVRPYSRSELFLAEGGSAKKDDRIKGIVRLALAAPREFDRELFEHIETASRDPEPEIRNAAAWGTIYLTWPAARSMLKRIAEEDPHSQVRQGAKDLLLSIEDGESGGA